MGNMRFKVGDRVRIKSLDWYNKNKDNYGAVYAGNGFCFWKNMARHCGEIMKITIVKVDPEDSNKGYYFMENSEEKWTDEMIEGLAEEDVDLIPKFGEFSDNEPLDIPTMTTDFIKEHGLPCPDGFIFKDENGNIINATKIVLEKKKKEYPKTYGYCCDTLDCCSYNVGFDRCETPYDVTLHNKLLALRKLLICRDAYWKIAGEEMGLGKPWKPYWNNDNQFKYIITCCRDNVNKDTYTARNTILAFPTKEMRDAFYENFKELIEEYKELL